MSKVAIVGLGLMGGSLGLAIKRFCSDTSVVGVDREPVVLEEAKRRGAIDWGTLDLQKGTEKAELIFIATPIHEVFEILRKLPKVILPNALVTDLGSTKAEVCKMASKFLPKNFVGGHPMTGSELQGMKGSDPFLFENAIYLLTPLKPKDKKVSVLSSFLERLGAHVITVSPELHDQVAAYVSHLPQLLAVALTQLICEKSKRQPLYRELAAGGFRDMTRIASSPYEIWHDILQSNAPKIRESLDRLIDLLRKLKNRIPRGSVKSLWKTAANFRHHLPIQRKGFIKPLHRIVITVKDEKGALAKITNAIATANINICDIELLKVREGFGGTFQLYFAHSEEATYAVQIMSKIGFESRIID